MTDKTLTRIADALRANIASRPRLAPDLLRALRLIDEWRTRDLVRDESSDRAEEADITPDAVERAARAVHWSRCCDVVEGDWHTEPSESDRALARRTLGNAAADALTDRYAANEARQREEAAEPDPLDEADHRDRILIDGGRIVRNGQCHWHTPLFGPANWCDGSYCGSPSLADWNRRLGPLTFAPDASPAPQDAAQGAAEGEDDAVEEGGPAGPSEALLCHECGHGIDHHAGTLCVAGLDIDDVCACPRLPSDIARHLIAQATP